jgi:hypothetical protein
MILISRVTNSLLNLVAVAGIFAIWNILEFEFMLELGLRLRKN